MWSRLYMTLVSKRTRISSMPTRISSTGYSQLSMSHLSGGRGSYSTFSATTYLMTLPMQRSIIYYILTYLEFVREFLPDCPTSTPLLSSRQSNCSLSIWNSSAMKRSSGKSLRKYHSLWLL